MSQIRVAKAPGGYARGLTWSGVAYGGVPVRVHGSVSVSVRAAADIYVCAAVCIDVYVSQRLGLGSGRVS